MSTGTTLDAAARTLGVPIGDLRAFLPRWIATAPGFCFETADDLLGAHPAVLDYCVHWCEADRARAQRTQSQHRAGRTAPESTEEARNYLRGIEMEVRVLRAAAATARKRGDQSTPAPTLPPFRTCEEFTALVPSLDAGRLVVDVVERGRSTRRLTWRL